MGIITPKKLILVKIRLEKVGLSAVYIQKVQENFKRRSGSNTKGVHYQDMSHPVGDSHLVGKSLKSISSIPILTFERPRKVFSGVSGGRSTLTRFNLVITPKSNTRYSFHPLPVLKAGDQTVQVNE